MKIAIPSYNRPETLKKKSVAYLLNEGFQATEIFVFLRDQDQLHLYQSVFDISLNFVVCNTSTLPQKRQFISDYFDKDEEVFSLDDDIRRLKMVQPRPLKVLLAQLFKMLRDNNLNIWGIYPLNNLYFCREKYKVGKQFINSCFYGFINRKDFIYPPLSLMEDVYFSCFRSEKDGGVLRFDGACPHTDFFAIGGLSSTRTPELEEETCKILIETFPHLLEYKKNKYHPFCAWKRQKTILLNQTAHTPL